MLRSPFFSLLLSLLLTFSAFAATPTTDNCADKWEQFLQVHQLPEGYKHLIGLCDDELKLALRTLMVGNRTQNYSEARLYLFRDVDNDHGRVCCVYTGVCIETNIIPSGSVMNTEHTWPQSRGAQGVAKADLHHLYPTGSNVNSKRGNNPFCEVARTQWSDHDSRLGFNSFNELCFEPPKYHRGNVARSLFYFSIRYNRPISAHEEAFLLKWNSLDPTNERDVARNDLIEKVQNNRNLFVDYPELTWMIADF